MESTIFCDTLVSQDRVGLNVPLYMDLHEVCDKQQQQQQQQQLIKTYEK
jgi:hypothetical protein